MNQNQRRVQVTVIGDATTDDRGWEAAIETGKMISEIGAVLITGGRTGIMEAASKGAFESGGTVVGILPGGDFSDANPYCHLVFPTGVGQARNSQTILAADVVIAIGGKSGTLSEIAFAWIYRKPLILMDYVEGWSKSIQESAVQLPENTFHVHSLAKLKSTLKSLLY